MKIQVISIHFTNKFRWLIGKDDPVSYDLLSLSDWTFINPLTYPQLYPSSTDEPFNKELNQKTLLVLKDHALLETNTLMFLSTVHTDSDHFNSTTFTDRLTSFSAHLRHTSKQAELTGGNLYSSILIMNRDFEEEQNLIEPPEPHFPSSTPVTGHKYYRKYNLDTAIRWSHLKKADESLANNNLPVYSTLLLDAIHAAQQHDYRRAILYSAMSVESLAATKLDEKYKSFLDNGDPTAMIRIVTIHGDKKEDPIYKIMLERNNFRQLLHERPLYLERRSLRMENEPLYQQAIKLYSTRNSIAHLGELTSEQEGKYFNLDWFGALFAIGCARDVFKWFGIVEEYFMPLDNMIDIDEYVLE